MLLDSTRLDSQSEQEVRKENRRVDLGRLRSKSAFTASRFSVDYWRDRVFRPNYHGGGDTHEVQEWYAQIQFAGIRKKVGLVTNNKEEACRKATRFYTTLRAKGWEAAHKELSPSREQVPGGLVTVGNFIEKIRPLADVRPRTFEVYAYALRKIARETMGVKDSTKRKYDPIAKGWRKETDLLPLIKLTPELISLWKEKVLSEAEQNPLALQRTRRNINSFARNARALFNKKLLKKLAKQGLVMPTPLPFDGFELEPQGSTKYDSKIDASKMLNKAKTELKTTEPEVWKVILLALGAGLRRSEIDSLCWGQVDFELFEVHVVNHAFFQAKTLDSEGKVFVDPALIAELKNFRNEDVTKPVVNTEIPFRQKTSSAQFYRCQQTFEKVTAWLRANGVAGERPLHTLRKEFGSIICASGDIHTASRQLRHSNLATTAAFYVDNRRRVTVPISTMLMPSTKTLRKTTRHRAIRLAN
jgi:integrase